MADAVTKCIAANPQISGRVVIRSYLHPTAVQVVEPMNNQQADSGVLDARYTNRFDDVGYYYK